MDIKAIWSQIKEQLGKLSKKTKTLLLVLLAVMVLGATIIAVVLNNRPYATLFTDLNQTEASEIMAKLTEMGVPYRYENGGAILVPEGQEDAAKAQLVSEGYPKSGLTYDIFTSNIDLMTTDSERQSYLLFDLQDRIASTIRHFDGVKEAIVTIALGEEQRYVLEQDKVESSASVVVIMQNGGTPNGALVDSIVRLTANAVPGMRGENVTVIDGNGLTVSSNEGGSTQYGMAQLKLSLESEIDNSIRSELLYILTPLYGEGQVRVSVKSTVDVDKKIREYIEYIPATEDNRGVISSEIRDTEIVRDGEQEEGGVPGAETNAEVPVYAGVEADGSEIYFNDQSQIDYVVSQIKEQVQSDSGVLSGIMVSVAINGTSPGAAKEQEIRNLIARTAGIGDEEKDTSIALVYGNFAASNLQQPVREETAPQGLTRYLWPIMGVAAGVLVLVLVAALISQGARRRREERDHQRLNEVLEVPEYVEAPPEDYIMNIKLSDIKKTREQALKQQITDFADENPEISAQLIKTWLKGVDME